MKFFCLHCVCDKELSGVELLPNDEVVCSTCGTAMISCAAIDAAASRNPTFRPLLRNSRFRLESLREAFNKMDTSAERKHKRQYFVWYDGALRASVWTELDNPSVEELTALAIDTVDAEGTRSWFVHTVAKLDKAKITIELANKSEASELILNDLAKLQL